MSSGYSLHVVPVPRASPSRLKVSPSLVDGQVGLLHSSRWLTHSSSGFMHIPPLLALSDEKGDVVSLIVSDVGTCPSFYY